jgi:hypothetical protein
VWRWKLKSGVYPLMAKKALLIGCYCNFRTRSHCQPGPSTASTRGTSSRLRSPTFPLSPSGTLHLPQIDGNCGYLRIMAFNPGNGMNQVSFRFQWTIDEARAGPRYSSSKSR